MAEVRTRDEALTTVDRGLAQWTTTAMGLLSQAGVAATNAANEAESIVRRAGSKVAAIEQVLSALGPDDDRRKLESDLNDARTSLDVARNAAQRITMASQQMAALQRAQINSFEASVSAARADLAKRGAELGSYRSDVGVGGASPVEASGSAGGSWTGSKGLSSVDVAAASFDDNPIQDGFTKGGTTRADYRWAVQTWDEVVAPGVAKGMTRDDFEARDSARSAPAFRRTAHVYDMFLGDADRLRVTRRADGTLDVTNGRHRLQIARELGIKSLPGEVIEP